MSENEKKSAKKEFLSFPFLTLIVMILITIGVTFIFYQNAVNKDLVRFNNETKELTKSLDYKISSSIMIIKAIRGYIEAEEDLSPEKFKTFVKSFELSDRYKSLQGIGYTQKILPDEKLALVEKMRSDGISNFQISTEGEHNEYQIITLIEPKDFKNEQEMGFDMRIVSDLNKAMSLAKDTGKPVASGITNILPNTNNEGIAGFVIYLPVYRGNELPKNKEDRDKLLRGYVFASFAANDFINGIYQNSSKNEVGILLYDEEIKPEKLFAASQNDLIETNSKLVTTNDIYVAERKWIIQFKSLPSFDEKSEIGWTFIVPLSGLFLSILLFGITYSEANSRLKFENAAAELKVSEAEKALLLQSEQTAREQAERSNLIKDEFLSVISHELRTPLNSIAGWTKILQGENLTDQTKARALKTIEKNIRSQSKLVEELLDFSKINAEDITFNKESVDFSKLLNNSIEEIKKLADEKKIAIVENINLNGEKLYCDSKTISRALSNLFRNAVKFTPQKGTIEIFSEQNKDSIFLSIKDDGQGIEEEFLPHIFEKFRQADSSITRKYGGLGLGLAISRQIIRLHDGEIKVSSEGRGKGTEFIIKLPLNPQNAESDLNKIK